MIPSIYINLDDDVSRIVTRIKRERSTAVVLVCPKRCFLFNDSINLRLLKKQTDLLNKDVYVLTMDERGQTYAREAGFGLKFLPKSQSSSVFSDVRAPQPAPVIAAVRPVEEEKVPQNPISQTVNSIKNFTKFLASPPKVEQAGTEVLNHQTENEPKTQSAPFKTGLSLPAAVIPKPENILPDDMLFPIEIEENEKIKKRRKTHQKIISFLVACSLLIILVVIFVILPKATVVIYPKTEPVTRDMEINISVNFQKPDPNRLVMPSTKVSDTISAESDFQSQGKQEVGNKGTGTVRIYNFTRAPINLKAATTVLTVGSKSYALVNDALQIRSTAYKNARTKEVDENSLSGPFDVIASEGGDEFNLPEGTRMEITNQVFGSRPLLLYAKTDSAISGGTSRYLSVISQTDVSSSQNTLNDMAIKTLRAKLALNNLVLADQAFALNSPQYTLDKPVGAQTPTFHQSLQVKIEGLTFNQQDLTQLVLDRINQTMSGDKNLVYNQNNALNYKVKTIDLNNGLALLVVHFEGQAVYKVDLSNIKEQLIGKTENQVSEILKSKPEIEHIDLTLAPIWQKNFPFFAKKIDVNIGQVVY